MKRLYSNNDNIISNNHRRSQNKIQTSSRFNSGRAKWITWLNDAWGLRGREIKAHAPAGKVLSTQSQSSIRPGKLHSRTICTFPSIFDFKTPHMSHKHGPICPQPRCQGPLFRILHLLLPAAWQLCFVLNGGQDELGSYCQLPSRRSNCRHSNAT